MKRFISLTLIIAIVLSLCACSYTGSNTKITVGVLTPVSTLDPVKAATDSERLVAYNCFEGLLRLDSNGSINLGGAVGYSVSGDNLTYTFKLNESAKWYIPDATRKSLKSVDYSDTVTADDYIYGIERYRSTANHKLDCIKSLKATDKFTLVITLDKPDIDFLYKLSTLPAFPCNKQIAKALGNKLFSSADYTPCNGTYYVNAYSKSETLLERNPDYAGSVQIANRYVSLYTTGSVDSLKSRFESKTYDMLFAPSTELLDGLTPSSQVVSDVWGLVFNTKTYVGENDILRAVLFSSVYRPHIESPYLALSSINNVIPDSFLVREAQYSKFNPEKLTHTYDPDTGKALLNSLTEEIGHTTYTVDFFVPLEMKENAETLITVWNEAYGDTFSFTLTTFELSETEKISTEGKYDIAILPLSPETNTAYGVLESLTAAPCFVSDSSFIKGYDVLPDEASIAEDLKATEKHLIENNIFMPLFTSSTNIYTVDELTGVYAVDGGNIIYLHAGTKPEEK